jgi:hypothetical protein
MPRRASRRHATFPKLTLREIFDPPVQQRLKTCQSVKHSPGEVITCLQPIQQQHNILQWQKIREAVINLCKDAPEGAR